MAVMRNVWLTPWAIGLEALALLAAELVAACAGLRTGDGRAGSSSASSASVAAGEPARPGEERRFRIIPGQSTASYHTQEK